MELFKIFAPTILASRGADGSMRIEGIASSTVRDGHGDQITRRGLEKMARSAKGMTIFLNHEYKVPEDVFGTVDRVKLERTGLTDPLTKEEVYDLRFGIVVQKANPRAVQAFEQMEAGDGKVPTKLGLSIGAMVPEGGAKFDKTAGGRYIVDDLDLVETSLVSMPANPRSWVEYAVKALSGKLPMELSLTKRAKLAETLEAEGFTVVDGVDDEELVEAPEVIEASADEPEPEAEAAAAAAESETAHRNVNRPTDEGEPKHADDERLAEGDHVGEDDATVDHEVTEQKTRVTVWDGDKTVEIDTGRAKPKTEDHSAQAGDGSENAGGPGVASKALEGGSEASAMLATSDRLLLSLHASLKVKEAENEQLREERDAAITAAHQAIESTGALLQKLADTPVGRKTAYVEAVEELSTIRDDIYSPEMIKLMKKGNP